MLELRAHLAVSRAAALPPPYTPPTQTAQASELLIALSVCSWIRASRVLFTCFIFHFMNKSITRLTLYRTGLALFIPFEFD